MQKKFIVLTLALVLMSAVVFSGEVKLGEKVTLEKATKVSEINAKPEKYIGKTVRIEGYIVGGCFHHGTWIAIASDKEFQQMVVWPKKGQIKFPLEHKGKYGIIEGKVYVYERTEEEAKNWIKHLNSSHEEKIAISKYKDYMKNYRLDPVSAVIKDQK